KIMVARQTLKLAATECVQRISIERLYDVGDVLAIVVYRTRDVVRSGDRGDAELCRRNHKALIDEDFGASRMVNRHEREIIVVINFPELRRDADIVVAVVGNELIAPDLIPFSSCRDVGGAESIDAQADGRPPRN